jgi:hypothetical protein
MRVGRWQILGILVSIELAGCSGVIYEKAYSKKETIDNTPSSAPKGGFAFSLRHSNIVLSGTDTLPSASQPSTNGTSPAGNTNSQTGNGSQKSAVASTKITCTDSTLATRDCLAGISVAASPESDRDFVYFARPLSTVRYLGGTTMSAKNDANDPLLIQSVSFAYKNQVANIITGAGTGAAAGVAFGPAGVWIGGLVGAAGGVFSGAPADPSDWGKYICKSEKQKVNITHATKDLYLPATVTFPVTAASGDDDQCWHILPAAKATGVPANANAGWFYRVVLAKDAPNDATVVPPVLVGDVPKSSGQFKLSSAYFTEAATNAQNTFPVTACRSVRLEVVWYQDIVGTAEPAESALGSWTLAAADPSVVQVLSFSNGTVATLLPCGGYASGAQPSSALSDDISGLIKQVQAVKSAQQQQQKGK